MKKHSIKTVNSPFVSAIYRTADRVISQAISLVVSLVLARILSPEDYAPVTMVTVVITILNVFVDSGLTDALIQKKAPDDLDYSSALLMGFVVSITIYLAILLLSPLIASSYGMDILVPVLRIMGLKLLLVPANGVLHAYVSKRMMHHVYFKASVVASLASGVLGIVMAVLGYGVWALVVQYLVFSAVSVLLLYLMSGYRFSVRFSWQRCKSLFSFGWKVLASSLMDVGYEEARKLIIPFKHQDVELSFYSKGQQLPQLISNNVSISAISVLFPVFSSIQDDKKRLHSALRRSAKVSSYLIFPIMIGFMAVSELFVRVIMTEKWLPAAAYMQIFCLMYMLKPQYSIHKSVLKGLGKSGLLLKLSIIEKIVGIIALVCVLNYSPVVLAWSAVGTYVFGTFLMMCTSRQLVGYTFAEQMRDTLPYLLLSIPMGVAAWFVTRLPVPGVAALCLAVCAGIVAYIVLSALFRVDSYKYLLDLLRSSLKKLKDKTNSF